MRAFIAAGAKGIISAGFAPGFAPPGEFEALKEAVAAGIVVMQCTRAGSGRTFLGKRLREAFPNVQIVAAEPLPGDPVMGLRSLEDGYVPPVLDVTQLDRKLLVSNTEAAAAVRVLLEREGLFAGVSAGAVVHVARRIADELPEGSVVVAVLADGGWKYLSAPFWSGEEIDEAVLWW